MKILFFIATGISIILESSFFPIPVTFIVFISLLPFMEEYSSVWVFVSGLVLDFFIPRPIGLDSLIMLMIVFIFKRYHKKIYSGRNLFTLLIQLSSISVYAYFFYNNIGKLGFIILLASSVTLFWFIPRIFPEKSTKKRLAL